MIFSDLYLSQRLERTEACANAEFVETRAQLEPESGAAWIEVGGAYAMFDGVESPCTQTFGLGMFEVATSEHLDEIEAFLRQRGAPVFHEVSPMADASLLPLLNERGYRPVELTSVLYLSLESAAKSGHSNPEIPTRVIAPDEVDIWAATSAAAWATEHEGLADFMFNFGRITANCPGSQPWLAERGGKPIATGMMFIHEGVAILAGASTIPDERNRGAQNALLSSRLSSAAETGCTLAMMGALPGSQSQKNAQKNGFQIAYSRIKWQLYA